MEWVIPAKAQEILRKQMEERQRIDAILALSVSLVLSSIGAPEDAQISLMQDGSMIAVEKEIPNVGKETE